MEEAQVRRALTLLHMTERPDIDAIFQRLAELKLYKELIEFLNKWQERQFEKCMTGVKKVIGNFQTRIMQDTTNEAVRDLQNFLKEMGGIHSEKALNTVLEILFGHSVDKAFLDVVSLGCVDGFLRSKTTREISCLTLQSPVNGSPMTQDQVKAAELLAKRNHRVGEHLQAGLIYMHLGCRQARKSETIDYGQCLRYLEHDALSQFHHAGSHSALEVLRQRTDTVKFQKRLSGAIGSADEEGRRLDANVLTAQELLNVITTHPKLKAVVRWREDLLRLVQGHHHVN